MYRLRVFAGPNGSGKSSIVDDLRSKGIPNLGVFINADEIEKKIKETGYLDCSSYSIEYNHDEFIRGYAEFINNCKDEITGKDKCQVKPERISYEGTKLIVQDPESIDSYLAAYIADYLRNKMLDTGNVFSIETVMSHPSKLDFMRLARKKGYKVYLYFVTTQSPLINVLRVETRVKAGGHDVKKESIISRYYRSLQNLMQAIELSDRAYLFDNSGKSQVLVAEYDAAKREIITNDEEEQPLWFSKYVLSKISQ